jgi:hypothetical protein
MRPAANVQVNIYEECDVDCEGVNVSVEAKDQVQWCSAAGSFVVEFEQGSSPFVNGYRFEVPEGKCVTSGPLKSGIPYATYHYKIQSRANLAMSADPDVNVKK